MRLNIKSISYIAGGTIIVFLLSVIINNKNRTNESPEIGEIEIVAEGSLYESKKAAYDDAYQKSLSGSFSPTSIYDKIIKDSLDNLNAIEAHEQARQSISQLEINQTNSNINKLKQTQSYNSTSTITDDPEYKNIEAIISNLYASPSQDQSTTKGNNHSVDELSEKERRRQSLLRSWNNNIETTNNNTFKAVIHGSQTVKNGQVAIFRLSEPINYKNNIITKNTLLFGQVSSIDDNRLNVVINSARIDKNIISIPLEIYGTDGIRGIPITVNEITSTTDSEVKNEAINQVGNVASNFGAVGRIIGNIATATARNTKREKDREVLLIDNQTVFIKILTK